MARADHFAVAEFFIDLHSFFSVAASPQWWSRSRTKSHRQFAVRGLLQAGVLIITVQLPARLARY